MTYLGELPQQEAGNLAYLNGLQGQLESNMAARARADQQKAYLESLLAQYQEYASAGVPVAGTGVSPTETIGDELAKLESQKADLMARYTAKYPDVVKIDEQIKATKALLATVNESSKPAKEETNQDESKTSKAPQSAAVAQVKSQLESNRIEIENLANDEKKLQVQIADYQHRLNQTPVREPATHRINSQLRAFQQHYDDLQGKKTQSEMATSLIRRQQAERFRIIDQPSFPTKPTSPARVKVSLGGLALGLGVGLGLVFLLETKNHSLRDEKELRRTFIYPLVLGVPLLQSKVEIRRRKVLAVFEWFCAAVLCLVVAAAEFYVYRRS